MRKAMLEGNRNVAYTLIKFRWIFSLILNDSWSFIIFIE